MIEIYALFSGRDCEIRYVGKTSGTRAGRFELHTKPIVGRYISKVCQWIQGEWREGFPVQTVLLDTCAEHSWSEVETTWMNKFPKLLNDRKYRYRSGPIPSIAEIRNYKRSHRANSGGFRGICWWGDIGYYTVLKPNGEWLSGDEAPGWSGENIFFSDLAAAIKAREDSSDPSAQRFGVQTFKNRTLSI